MKRRETGRFRQYPEAMLRSRRPLIGLVALALLAAACSSGGSSTPSSTTTTSGPPGAVNATLSAAHTFDPKTAAVNGSTDVYHCTLFDPQATEDRMVTSSSLKIDQTKEVHHAIYFLVAPEQVAAAKALDQGGNGWTCFGDPLNTSGSFGGTTWLGAWAPGGNLNKVPAGTAIPLPKGSLIVVQIHYNLLAGSTPDNTAVRLTTVPAAGSSLTPIRIQQIPAPPDLPCAAGVTGPLCDRTASLADLGARFGSGAVDFVNGLEALCHHDPTSIEQAGPLVSTSCQLPFPGGLRIRQSTLHMHLLGVSGSVELLRGSGVIPLENVAAFNFDEQRTVDVPNGGVVTQAGDKLRVHCTYNPALRSQLSSTKKLPPRYVTWGDGSSDEMCLAILAITAGFGPRAAWQHHDPSQR